MIVGIVHAHAEAARKAKAEAQAARSAVPGGSQRYMIDGEFVNPSPGWTTKAAIQIALRDAGHEFTVGQVDGSLTRARNDGVLVVEHRRGRNMWTTKAAAIVAETNRNRLSDEGLARQVASSVAQFPDEPRYWAIHVDTRYTDPSRALVPIERSTEERWTTPELFAKVDTAWAEYNDAQAMDAKGRRLLGERAGLVGDALEQFAETGVCRIDVERAHEMADQRNDRQAGPIGSRIES